MFLVGPYTHPPGTMLSAIQRAGLTSGLNLCLDARDINSYPGSGQKWLDTSGGGYDFFLGASASAQSSDPTFNGTAGGQSSEEYWSFDGGDRFLLAQTNPSWVHDLHKPSKSNTIATWVYIPSFNSTHCILGTDNNGTGSVGVTLNTGSSGRLFLSVYNGSQGLVRTSNTTMTAGAWNFCGISWDSGATTAGTEKYVINSTEESEITSSVSFTASSANAANVLNIGSSGGAVYWPLPNGSRLGSLMIWTDEALTPSQMSTIFQLSRGWYGI